MYRFSILIGALLALMPALARAQSPGQVDPYFNSNLGLAGYVDNAVPLIDGTVLVVGRFTRGIIRLKASGALDQTFDAATGATSGSSGNSITCLALQSDGKIIIGGDFTAYNGVSRNRIARLNADGSLDVSFNPGTGANYNVIAVAVQSDGKILLTGSFTALNGTTQNRIARLNTDGSLDTGFAPGSAADNRIWCVAVQSDGKILIGGEFLNVNGIPRSCIARLNVNGSLDTSFNPGTGANAISGEQLIIESMTVQNNGKIIIGGGFGGYNGTTRNCIAQLNTDGSIDTSFNPGTGTDNGFVTSIAVQSDSKVVIVGDFSTYNSTNRSGIARLNANGSLDTSFNPGTGAAGDGLFTAYIQSIVIQGDGKLIAGGSFTIYNGTGLNSVARIQTDGSLDTTFVNDATVALGFNSDILCVASQSGGKTLVGGYFSTFNGANRNHIVRLNADGSLDTSFNPGNGADSYITAMALQSDGKIVIGGNFSNFNGTGRVSIARLNTDGSLDTGFVPATSPGDTFSAVAVQTDGRIVVGGYFRNYTNNTSNRILRLNTDGSRDTSFDSGAGSGATTNGSFNTVRMQSDGRLLLAGAFTMYNGTSCKRIVRLNANGTLDTTFSPDPTLTPDGALVAVQSDGKIILGGYVTANGVSSGSIARLNIDGSLDPSFNIGTGVNGTKSSMALQSDGKIVLEGVFTTYNGIKRRYIARLSTDGSVDLGFDPGMGADNGLYSLALQSDGRIIAGGTFDAFDGTKRDRVARLNADGSLDSTFSPGGVLSIQALALQPNDGNVIVGGAFSFAGGQPANALARLRNDGSLDPTFTAPFSPGDSVPAFARQPKDGNLVASRVPVTTASSPNSLMRLAAVRPKTQSIIKNPIVRCLGVDGSSDPTFYTGAGTDGTAYALGIQSDAADAGKIVVAGSFTQLNSVSGHTNLGRLNTDGSLDTGFAASANATVQTVLVQADGQLVVGGLFTQVDGIAHARLARLNAADGTLDASFSPTASCDGPVAGLLQQSDGRLVVGGSFATVNGQARSCLARLNADGTLDASFNAGTISLSGGVALVSSVAQQADGKLVIGGLFDTIGGISRPNVARLNTDGSVDTTFDPGSGTDAIVRVVTLQPDGKTLLGGDFSTVDGLERDAAARLLGNYDLDDYPALGQWHIINFGSPNATGNAADTTAPYGDGVPNLLKYALNLDPQGPDATPMTATGTKGLPLPGKDSTGKYLTLTFVRRQAATAPGVTYLVEFANSLASPTGFATNPSATSAVSPLDATWERVTVTDSVPVSSQSLARFVHLRITDP